MAATPDELLAHLTALGIDVTVHEHPPLFTVEDSKALRGELPGGHHKNLYLRDHKKRNYLVVTLEDADIDLKALPDRIGSGRLSFGSAARLQEFLGISPGSVSPFAVINDPDAHVQVVLDEAILAATPLNFHPLVNTMTIAVSADGLLTFLRESRHEPLVVPLSPLPLSP